VLLPLYISLAGVLPSFTGLPVLVLIYTSVIAFLTISTIPMVSSKKLGQNINRSYVIPLFVGAVLLAGMLIANTFETLAGLILLYLASIPVGIGRYRAMDRTWKAEQAALAGAAKPEPAAQ
jgi:CDP-diacylglycerol---serine O-phosphatidyltransferase